MALADSDEPLVLVVGSDDNYAMPLAVTLYSALSNLAQGSRVHIYLLDGGIRPENRHRMERVVDVDHATVHLHWRSPDTASLEGLRTHEWITSATYLRLLIPDVLPDRFDKAIYLDSDLQVEADLTRLWNEEMNGQALLAVQGYGAPYVSSPLGIVKYEELGLLPDTPYFNAGVLVINVRKWREENVSQKVIQYVREYEEHVQMNDQEGLNVALANNWGALDAKWNVMNHIRKLDSWPPSPFKEEMRVRQADLLQNAHIFHFAGGSKPWQIGCQHPTQLRWTRYLWRSGWFTPAEAVRWFAEWYLRYGWRRVKEITGLYGRI